MKAVGHILLLSAVVLPVLSRLRASGASSSQLGDPDSTLVSFYTSHKYKLEVKDKLNLKP